MTNSIAFSNRVSVSHGNVLYRTQRYLKIAGYKTGDMKRVLTALEAYELAPDQDKYNDLMGLMW